MTLSPRVVVVHRATELDQLLARHGTPGQAGFFLRSRGRDLTEVTARHQAQQDALAEVAGTIPVDWRRVRVERADLPRFAFAAEDVVVVVGQDGLVANIAKYLDGQPVIGLDPEPGRNPGILVPHPASALAGLLARYPDLETEDRTMVAASLDDGQQLTGLNEVFVGHASHQSARYRLWGADGWEERQSSSGLLVGTGTGATGWCRSVALERHSTMRQPAATEAAVCWYVREAWPSPGTGVEHTEGRLGSGDPLTVVAESDLVVFADGIESDALTATWGQSITVQVATGRLRLVC